MEKAVAALTADEIERSAADLPPLVPDAVRNGDRRPVDDNGSLDVKSLGAPLVEISDGAVAVAVEYCGRVDNKLIVAFTPKANGGRDCERAGQSRRMLGMEAKVAKD